MGGLVVHEDRLHAVEPDRKIVVGTFMRLEPLAKPEYESASTPSPAEPGRDVIVCLQMDMTGVRMLKRYLKGARGRGGGDPKGSQIKCGTLFLMERDAEGRYRRISGSAVHVTSFCAPVSFSDALDKARQKLAAPHGATLVVVADGAEWIWNIVSDRFKEAFSIIDFWHAADRLHDLCEFALGKGDAAQALFKEWRKKMKVYGVDCVIRHFEGMEGSRRKLKGVAKRLAYFKRYRGQMQYRRFRREGWPIGSGAVEGACKSLIKQRTNLSGQRWSPDGALDVLCYKYDCIKIGSVIGVIWAIKNFNLYQLMTGGIYGSAMALLCSHIEKVKRGQYSEF